MWIDGARRTNITNLDNHTRRIDRSGWAPWKSR
jgi:hypothetical protein